MPSALDMIKKSMRLNGSLGQSETPTADEASDALASLNSMLEAWSIEKLMVYQILKENFTWTANQSSRTIGAGGNFNTTRPTKIENGFTRISNQDYHYIVVDKEVYDAQYDKTAKGDFPSIVYFEQGVPLATIYGYPVPDASIDFHLNSWKQLQSFAALTTSLSLPAGYQRAIEYNLAVELHGEYPDLQLPDSVVLIARQSKAAIKRVNDITLIAQTEIGGFRRGFGQQSNILSGP